MLVQDPNGHAQPVANAKDKIRAELEPSEDFSFPRLKEAQGNATPHLQARTCVKGMLLSGFWVLACCSELHVGFPRHASSLLGPGNN